MTVCLLYYHFVYAVWINACGRFLRFGLQFSPQNEHHHVRSLGELLNPSPAGGDMKELLSLSTVYIAGNSKLHDLSSAMKSVKLNAARLKEKAYRIRTDVDETATFFHECVESRKRDLHDQLDKEVEERTCYLTDYGRGMENLHKGINQVSTPLNDQKIKFMKI